MNTFHSNPFQYSVVRVENAREELPIEASCALVAFVSLVIITRFIHLILSWCSPVHNIVFCSFWLVKLRALKFPLWCVRFQVDNSHTGLPVARKITMETGSLSENCAGGEFVCLHQGFYRSLFDLPLNGCHKGYDGLGLRRLKKVLWWRGPWWLTDPRYMKVRHWQTGTTLKIPTTSFPLRHHRRPGRY